MKNIIIITILILFTCNISISQIVPDSLKGIYTGFRYYKPTPDSSWIITPDTEYVTSMDTITCNVSFHGCFFPGATFRTGYTFCNNPPANPYGDGTTSKQIVDLLFHL